MNPAETATAAPGLVGSADQFAKLESIAASGACAAGRVVTLNFGAIQARLGDRWGARHATILAKLDAIVERQATRRSIWLRVKDCEYLVCFSEDVGTAAAAVAFRLMEEGLTFFLGDFDPQDIKVSAVTSVDDGVVRATPVSPGAPAPGAFPTVAAAKRMIPILADLASPVMIDDAAERLRLSCALEEVVNLKQAAAVGCRLAPRLYSERSRRTLTAGERAALSTRALTVVDGRMVNALPALLAEDSAQLVIAPLSLHTFSVSKGRLNVIDVLNRLDGAGVDRLVIELTGVEPGTPVSKLAEAAALLRPFCRGAMAQSPGGRSVLPLVRQAGLPAMSVSAHDVGRSGSKLAAGLLAFGQAAQAGGLKLVAAELPDESFLEVCTVAGFTMATIKRADFSVQADPAPIEVQAA